MEYGPTLPISQYIHATKYRNKNENFYEAMCRIAGALADGEEHRLQLKDILLDMRFMPAGRVQAAVGSVRQVTPYNCFVSGVIEDNMRSIMQKADEAAFTMKLGGGIGYDFSRLRPRGSPISTLDSGSSGPVSFMDIYNSVCKTVVSAGNRRGAQMGVLRVDHPDIEEFINVKQDLTRLNYFNVSVGVTDEFMLALQADADFDLRFEGKKHRTVRAAALWENIMRNTWDYAEPGVLFLDTINDYNNLYYCEKIAATNPCSEQPLGPYGACLLGSFNLVKYLYRPTDTVDNVSPSGFVKVNQFDYEKFRHDITHVVRAMDNVINNAKYPLPEQRDEAISKRRMGLGITGLANAGTIMGLHYNREAFLEFEKRVLTVLRDTAYMSSVDLSIEKGVFKLFNPDKYLGSKFIHTLPDSLKSQIYQYGIRNSHLLSIAPTGTISLCADNISSGIEPPYRYVIDRTIHKEHGLEVERVEDYAYRLGYKGVTADMAEAQDHLNVLLTAAPLVDSSVSKTCNVGSNVSWGDFKDLYFKAWKGKAKGLTTFRDAGKRVGILQEVEGACYYDPETGNRSCE